MASTSWMPSQGRHSVNIGPSLGRAIKNRKLKDSPAPTARRSNLPERDFYAFRFNFKASSIDSNKPASIETKKGPETTQVVAEYPSKDPTEVHVFNGTEQPAKEVDCVLIYDEETGQYTLEKLDSFVLFKYECKRAVSPSAASIAPLPTASSVTSRKGKGKADDDDDLERLLLEDDAEGELDDSVADVLPTISRRFEEEEEEGEEIEVPLAVHRPSIPLPSRYQAPPQAKQAPGRAVKPLPKSKVEPKPQPQVSVSVLPVASATSTPINAQKAGLPAKPTPAVTPTPAYKPPAPTAAAAPRLKPVPRPSKKAKPLPASAPTATTVPSSHVDDEVLEISKPPPPKRPRPSATTAHTKPVPPPPQPKAPVELSLPGMGGSQFVAPPPPPGSATMKKPGASAAVPPTVPTPVAPPISSVPPGVSATITMEEVSDDDEEWEAVPTSASAINQQQQAQEYDTQLEDEIFLDFGMEEVDPDRDGEPHGGEEEIDVNAFAAELNEQMEGGWGDEEVDPVFGEDADEDEDMEDAMAIPEDAGRQILSLNRLAGGDSEDEFSSSESDSD